MLSMGLILILYLFSLNARYNSTIFAYGQTGSGKTFTITGGVEKYNDRGIIPRSISMIFNEKRTRTDVEMKIYISYLEIYNDQGYDLLDPSHEVTALEDLPKVSMLEDEHGNFHLKNLSVHPVATEVEALDLLFYGDTNRAIAETPMNLVCDPSSPLSPPTDDAPSTGLFAVSLHLYCLY
jgi:kinesin family member 6/9